MEYSAKIHKSNNDGVAVYTHSVYTNNCANFVLVRFKEKQIIFKNTWDNMLLKDVVQMNANQRKYLGATLSDSAMISPATGCTGFLSQLSVFVSVLGVNESINIEEIELIDIINQSLANVPLYTDMVYVVKINNINVGLKVTSLCGGEHLKDDTKINCVCCDKIKLTGASSQLFRSDFSIDKLNIGGLSEELSTIFRRAFSTRLMDAKMCKDLGIMHVKGIMLHGAPGCGKTLIARELGKIIGCSDPKIVAGPELISTFQGQSEKNVRDLFTDPINNPNSTYVIIIDECDALLKTRKGLGNGTADNITNQFLTMIDGVNTLNNVILIGMTNRLDLIDEAMLRPGRFEIILEIPLPTLKGREEIFDVHIKKINEKFRNIFDTSKFAALCDNYTGAEIASVVANAKSKAITRVINIDDLSNIDSSAIMIEDQDILDAINETIVSHGTKSKTLQVLTDNHETNVDQRNAIVETIRFAHLQNTNVVTSICLHGNTIRQVLTMAAYVAFDLNTLYVSHVNAEMLLKNDNDLYDMFAKLFRSKTSVIVLECIENIIRYNPLLRTCDNNILQVIYVLLNKIIPLDTSIYVIITSQDETLCRTIFPNIKSVSVD